MIQRFMFPKKCPECGASFMYSDGETMTIITVDGARYLVPKFIQCPKCQCLALLKREITKK